MNLNVIKKVINIYNTTEISEEDEIIPEKKQRMFFNSTNTVAFIPLKKGLYHLCRVVEPRKSKLIRTKLWGKPANNEIPISKYNISFLTDIMDIVAYYSYVKISMNHNYPITFRTEDFMIVLAPCVGDDEN